MKLLLLLLFLFSKNKDKDGQRRQFQSVYVQAFRVDRSNNCRTTNPATLSYNLAVEQSCVAGQVLRHLSLGGAGFLARILAVGGKVLLHDN